MEALLRALQSIDNAERDAAEKRFTEALKSDVRASMNELLQCVLVSPDAGVCEAGAVLFRGQLVKRSVGDRWWKTLSAVEKDGLRRAVLERMQSAPSKKLKRHVTQLVAQIASMSLQITENAQTGEDSCHDEWPSLLNDLGTMIAYTNDSGELSNAAVLTLGELVKMCPFKFEDGNTMLQLQGMLVSVLTNPINGNNVNRMGAVYAMQQLLTFVEDEDASHFAEGMTALMHSLEPIALCTSPSDDHLLKWFENVIEVIQWQPTLFSLPGSALGPELVGAMLKIAGAGASGAFSEEVRRQSLEVVANLVCHIPAVIKDDVEAVRAILRVCLTMMLESEDGPEEFEEDEDLLTGGAEEDLLNAGARGISALCESFGEERTLPLLFPMVQELLDPTLGGGNPASVSQSQHLDAWRRERVGLMTLERASYSGGKLMYSELQTILMRILPFAMGETCVTKVRLAALDALCGVLVNFCEVEGMFVDDDDVEGEDRGEDESEKPNVQTMFAGDLLAAICGSIAEPHANTKAAWAIKAKGAYCVTTFCCGFDDGTGGEVLSPHAPEILTKLHRLIELSGAVQNVQAQQQQAVQNGTASAPQGGFVDVIEVQKNCLESVGCMAKALGDGFAPYYDTFMPITKTVYQLQEQNAASNSNMSNNNNRRNGARGDKESQLRGIALDTISSMGLAAGREKFSQDAHSLVGMIVHYMDNIWAAGDADRNRQVAQLAVNICTWMDKVDEQILGKIVPKFMAWSEVSACTLEEADGDEDDNDEEDEGIQRFAAEYVDESGETKPGYVVRNVYLVREKETAIRMLQELIAGLGENLMPWAGHLAELMMKETEPE